VNIPGWKSCYIEGLLNKIQSKRRKWFAYLKCSNYSATTSCVRKEIKMEKAEQETETQIKGKGVYKRKVVK
jgi:hypothetical protein